MTKTTATTLVQLPMSIQNRAVERLCF